MFTPTISTARYLKPRHRGMFAVDIVSFGRRNPRLGLLLRETLYTIIQEACDAAGMCWQRCYHEDRGDGIIALAPDDESIETLMDPFATHVRTGISGYNKILADEAQIRVRMAIHAGYVFIDNHGITGPAVTHVFRLLQVPAFRTRLAQHRGDFGLIISNYLYDEIIGYGPGQIDPGSFQPIAVDVKETRGRAWIWLPAPQTGGNASSADPAGRSRHLVIHRLDN